MSKINDGGSAFPVLDNPGDGALYCREAGMSLRDWFAGQALAGLISSTEEHFIGDGRDEKAVAEWGNEVDRRWAAYCYHMADAMIAAREADYAARETA